MTDPQVAPPRPSVRSAPGSNMTDIVEHFREISRRDDCFIHMVPSDVRMMLSEIERLRAGLALILPMAKGYAAAHRVGSNARYVKHAEALLSPGSPDEGKG